MDLVYLSENFAFDSMRTSYYDTYQKTSSWKNNSDAASVKNMNTSGKRSSNDGSQNCKLCKDQSKKQLSNYIRQKSYTEYKNSIIEEPDDNE